jgi:hypothetical protein
MLSLTDQLLPPLIKVLADEEEQQVKLETKGKLFELLNALKMEYPQLFEGHPGFMMSQ